MNAVITLEQVLALTELIHDNQGYPWEKIQNRQYLEDLHRMNLSHSGRKTLVLLGKEGEVNQRRLAEMLQISPQAVSETVKKLVHYGCINKVSGKLKNENRISLTPMGEGLANLLKEIIYHHAQEFFTPLQEEERLQFHALLEKLLQYHQSKVTK